MGQTDRGNTPCPVRPESPIRQMGRVQDVSRGVPNLCPMQVRMSKLPTEPIAKDVLATDGGETARKALDPVAHAASLLPGYSVSVPDYQLGFSGLVDEFERQCSALARDDLSRPEQMLLAQAHTLDAIFGKLMAMARDRQGYNPDGEERYMRIALKAQNQCRTTLETLLHYKRPPMVIARQANVTSGPQQVNNTLSIESGPNKLLEQTDGERLDARAARADGEVDSHLEAVGAVHRTEDGGG